PAARLGVIIDVELEQLGQLLGLGGRHLVRRLGRRALLAPRVLHAAGLLVLPGSLRLLGFCVDLFLEFLVPLRLAALGLAVAGAAALGLLVAEAGAAAVL